MGEHLNTNLNLSWPLPSCKPYGEGFPAPALGRTATFAWELRSSPVWNSGRFHSDAGSLSSECSSTCQGVLWSDCMRVRMCVLEGNHIGSSELAHGLPTLGPNKRNQGGRRTLARDNARLGSLRRHCPGNRRDGAPCCVAHTSESPIFGFSSSRPEPCATTSEACGTRARSSGPLSLYKVVLR